MGYPTIKEINERLDKLQLELEESKKNKVNVRYDTILTLIKLGNIQLAERELEYGINFKSILRKVAEDLIKEIESGKKLNIIY